MADHLMTGEMGLSVNGEKFGLLMRDVGTDIGDILATKTKSKLDTVQAIREFGADMRWKFFASDNAPELKAAATFKQMVHLPSTRTGPSRTASLSASSDWCRMARVASWPKVACPIRGGPTPLAPSATGGT